MADYQVANWILSGGFSFPVIFVPLWLFEIELEFIISVVKIMISCKDFKFITQNRT